MKFLISYSARANSPQSILGLNKYTFCNIETGIISWQTGHVGNSIELSMMTNTYSLYRSSRSFAASFRRAHRIELNDGRNDCMGVLFLGTTHNSFDGQMHLTLRFIRTPSFNLKL